MNRKTLFMTLPERKIFAVVLVDLTCYPAETE